MMEDSLGLPFLMILGLGRSLVGTFGAQTWMYCGPFPQKK